MSTTTASRMMVLALALAWTGPSELFAQYPPGYCPPGHWIYGYLHQVQPSPYSAIYNYGHGLPTSSTVPEVKRGSGPEAPGRSSVNPALPYRNFEDYLRKQPVTAPAPSVGGSPQVPSAAKQGVGQMEVHVDDEKAEIFINDLPTTQTGLVRIFATPPLAEGKSYTLKVQARWGNLISGFSETRDVEVGAGKTAKVVFTEKK